KFQNIRAGSSILDRVHRIQQAGMEVISGMILGFDNDDTTIFEAQRQFIRESKIVNVMVGMLHAIPKTPLHARLASEGRLDRNDVSEFGTNVIPRRLSREELCEGYMQVMYDLHEPGAYFDRLEDLYVVGGLQIGRAQARHLRRRPWRWLSAQA